MPAVAKWSRRAYPAPLERAYPAPLERQSDAQQETSFRIRETKNEKLRGKLGNYKKESAAQCDTSLSINGNRLSKPFGFVITNKTNIEIYN